MPKLSVTHGFNAADIAAFAPDATGAYVILSDVGGAFRCLFVGSGNIRDELGRRLSGDDPCIARMGATHFQYVRSVSVEADTRTLQYALRPACNGSAA